MNVDQCWYGVDRVLRQVGGVRPAKEESATDADTRRFIAMLCIIFGPLFIGGGFLAAFTVEGEVYVFIGAGMIAAGLLLRIRLPLPIAVAAGVLVSLALTAQMMWERSR